MSRGFHGLCLVSDTYALDSILILTHNNGMREIIQTGEFSDWYQSLDADAQEHIYQYMEVLKEYGPKLGRPYVDTVKGSAYSNMKELRVQSKGRPFRIFFAFDPKRNAVLLIGGNKKGDTRFYKTMIPISDRLYSEYLEDMKNEKTKQ